MIIYLLHNFNNYYNRIVKRFSSIAEYKTAVGNGNWAQRGTTAITAGGYGPVNFNINDGITADITYNYIDGQEWEPDYVLAVDDNDTNIIYRFFVLEAVRTRKYQYKLTLRRDLIADNYTAVLDQPMYIEKATLSAEDPFIFNKEGNTYNQIKDEYELLLKDKTKSAWYVGYVATSKLDANGQRASADIATTPDYNMTATEWNTFKQNVLNNGSPNIVWRPTDWKLTQPVRDSIDTAYGELWAIYADGTRPSDWGRATYLTESQYYHFKLANTYPGSNNAQGVRDRMSFWYSVWRQNWPANCEAAYRAWLQDKSNVNFIDQASVTQAVAYNHKIVHETTNDKYYRITISVTPESNLLSATYTIPTNNSTAADQTLYNVISEYNISSANSCLATNSQYDHSSFILQLERAHDYQVVRYDIDSIPTPAIKVNVNLYNTIKMLDDAPYAMFAIPANGIDYKYDSGTAHDGSANVNLAAAMAIASLGSEMCYDVQLVPYCPIIAAYDEVHDRIDVSDNNYYTEDVNYTYIYDDLNSAKMGVILWANKSTGTFDITNATEYFTDNNKLVSTVLSVGDTAEDVKVENETSMYRLVSPNYSGAFDFSVAKNGTVNYLNVDYQYKPYQPYIHINPNFKNMYGADTNDARGLVCAGDFSIPTVTDQWKQFEINNKNYQKSFDRQIESMDTMHEYDKEERNWKALAGVLGGAAIGAKAGSMTGIPGGAGIGAAAGTIAATVGGVVDWRIQEGRYAEQKSYAVDSFNLSLGNVQARPNILTKVSAYNPNNKIWPFIEHYHATQAEVDALKDQLKYNGMTVNKIGKIQDYLQSDYSFIRGKLIRLENGGMEFHEQMELANELEKGVFIK